MDLADKEAGDENLLHSRCSEGKHQAIAIKSRRMEPYHSRRALEVAGKKSPRPHVRTAAVGGIATMATPNPAGMTLKPFRCRVPHRATTSRINIESILYGKPLRHTSGSRLLDRERIKMIAALPPCRTSWGATPLPMQVYRCL